MHTNAGKFLRTPLRDYSCLGVHSLCPGHENACQNIKIIPNAENRGLNVNRSPLVAHCDAHFSGWYQFRHSNETKVLEIPTSTEENFTCHTHKKCGTEIPITLRYKETQKDLTVYDGCFDFIWCCLYKIEVCSKKCDDAIVYYLSPPFGCPMAYCTGGTQQNRASVLL